MSGAGVRALQQHLASLGYEVGASGADGVFGERTPQAVTVIERDRGLAPDGVVGPETSAALAAALARPGPQPPRTRRFRSPKGLAQARTVFGDIKLVTGPDPSEACYLRAEGDWAQHNLARMTVGGIPAAPRVWTFARERVSVRESTLGLATSAPRPTGPPSHVSQVAAFRVAASHR